MTWNVQNKLLPAVEACMTRQRKARTKLHDAISLTAPLPTSTLVLGLPNSIFDSQNILNYKILITKKSTTFMKLAQYAHTQHLEL